MAITEQDQLADHEHGPFFVRGFASPNSGGIEVRYECVSERCGQAWVVSLGLGGQLPDWWRGPEISVPPATDSDQAMRADRIQSEARVRAFIAECMERGARDVTVDSGILAAHFSQARADGWVEAHDEAEAELAEARAAVEFLTPEGKALVRAGVDKRFALWPKALVEQAMAQREEPMRACRVCGCTDDRACEGGCWWVATDLCSNHPHNQAAVAT